MIDKSRNKRLGQYFTGMELAKVLSHIAFKINPKINTVIDPMLGLGEMLLATSEISDTIKAYGIELDNKLKVQLTDRFNNGQQLVFGNVFEPKTISQLKENQFNLVITNPPYVRPLNQKEACEFEDFIAPSNSQIRADLISSLETNPSLLGDERDYLIHLSKSYSGLSDLSVPSIIQCTALTKNDGVLALVIPESCLTREYSICTLLTLFKLFDIKVIVKDETRKWFDNAQVKTLLLIGQKLKKQRNSVLDHPEISIVEVIDENSNSNFPLGNNEFSNNYELFASTILKNQSSLNRVDGFNQYYTSVNTYLEPLLSNKNIDRHFLKIAPELSTIRITNGKNKPTLDSRLAEIVKCNDWIKIEELNVEIRQGLRTGANSFFYYDFISEANDITKTNFKVNKYSKEIIIPNCYLKTVLRKQNELPKGYNIVKSALKGRLLTIDNYFTISDIQKFNFKGDKLKKLPKEISNHIEYCEKLNIGSDTMPKYFPELSAVKTNISFQNGVHKNWYHLPQLNKRHLPNICIPRVNSKFVKTFSVQHDVVIDANFLTICLNDNNMISTESMVALLNSNWVRLQLELIGNVLGGGALKLDRNHLRSILIPKALVSDFQLLGNLGNDLINLNNDEALAKINQLVNSKLNLNETNSLKTLLELRLKTRNKNA
jgi:hypothetical protein